MRPTVRVLLSLGAVVALLTLTTDAGSRANSAFVEGTSPRHVVLIEARTGKVDRDFPDLKGPGLEAVSDGAGGWFVAGSSLSGGKGVETRIVRLRADGRRVPKFDLSLRGSFSIALVRSGEVLYLGGESGVAAVATRSQKLLWRTKTSSSLSPSPIGVVTGLARGNGVVYAAGLFTRIGAVARSGFAALDAQSGKPTAWRVALDYVDIGYGASAPFGKSIAVAGGVVYIGGVFNRVGGARRNSGLAAVDPRTGRPTSWAPVRKYGPSGRPYAFEPDAILVSHGQVLAGGGGFSVFDARTARRLAWRERLAGTVTTFAFSRDTVYLGGDVRYGFTRAGGRPANNLVSVRLPEGRFTDWLPNIAPITQVTSIAVSGDKVLVAGEFASSVG
jgi:hypothetical protein